MPVMLVCHCMFAIFVFSGGAFFESAYLADALSSDVDVRGGGRTKRQTTQFNHIERMLGGARGGRGMKRVKREFFFFPLAPVRSITQVLRNSVYRLPGVYKLGFESLTRR